MAEDSLRFRLLFFRQEKFIQRAVHRGEIAYLRMAYEVDAVQSLIHGFQSPEVAVVAQEVAHEPHTDFRPLISTAVCHSFHGSV